MYTLKKSTELHQVVMVIKDYKRLIKSQHIHTQQILLKYVKVKC